MMEATVSCPACRITNWRKIGEIGGRTKRYIRILRLLKHGMEHEDAIAGKGQQPSVAFTKKTTRGTPH